MKKSIAILGSTGSIGTQALDVIRANPEIFSVEVLTAQNNAGLLIKQALEFKPNAVVIGNESLYEKVREALDPHLIKVFCGEKSLEEIVEFDNIDTILTAMVGFAGLKPTLRAIRSGKNIALANKETLVVAGNIITREAKLNGVNIYPVDSEHSAIFQCMAGEFHNPIEKIYLTASGGPFRGKDKDYLKNVKKEDALKHPNWDMGCKITIDSATLMNKGLEVIEARWLFALKPEQIKVIVHPQSIIHSIVQFEDGSMKAQMGLPDMKLPIQYALAYPHRVKSDFPRFNFMDYPELTFEEPDSNTFRNLDLAYMAMEKDGNMPCILNAANEIAVAAFLKDKTGFLEMSEKIEQCMHKIDFIEDPSFDDLCYTDQETRKLARELFYGSNRFSDLPC
ncbi:MAG: 1-deoxy-D-xylulose-5-phosphate reductoisomerase [Bacteroidales bacterium]|nr:1-deoxy-D-xylulose-5-phosphate reductoisomerase [Bacteroidales bacterium]